MPKYSTMSMSRLYTCHELLERLMLRVVDTFDCTIIYGSRGAEEQNAAFAAGYSKLKFPESLHNWCPSFAVDALPYPIKWDDRDRNIYFAGFVMGTAQGMGIPLIWGGDWNKNWQIKDTNFEDFAHFQLDYRALGINPEDYKPAVVPGTEV